MVIINQLDHIRFRKEFTYANQAPTFVSTNVGGLDEIARWVLDRNGILYKDEPHMPFNGMEVIDALSAQPGDTYGPVLVMTDTLLYEVESIVTYFESRCPPHLRLIPTDDSKQLALNLFKLFARDLCDLVQKYMIDQLLSAPKMARAVFGRNAPFGERLQWRLFFPFLRSTLRKRLRLAQNTPDERLIEIKKIFAQVDAWLADGRRYLAGGNTLSIADVAFAAVAAPMILPEEFGGVVPKIQQVPDDYRQAVIALRQTAAGQFVLRVYQENRPMPVPQSKLPGDPTFFTCVGQSVGDFFARRQPGLFAFLQKHFPVLKVPFAKVAIVTRNNLLTELIERNLDFTIEEINSAHMASQKGAFFLGWDKNNPQFDRERDFARAAVRNTDLTLIRGIVLEEIDKVLAGNRNFGKIDVANTLCRPIYIRLIDRYFGIAAANDQIMMAWIRILFYDLFLNLTRNERVHQRAVRAGVERRDWVRQVIRDRQAVLDRGGELPDNVLNRMILLARQPSYQWVSEDVINRSIGGIITGVLETSNKAVVYSLSVLLDRPDMLKSAIEVAIARKDDMTITMDKDPMYGYVAECLRFMPVQPGVLRFAEEHQTLTGGGTKPYTIKAKTKILAMTAAAMRDPAAFPDPSKFDPTRAGAGAPYKNWGFGLHECFGRYINTVLIPDFVAAVLRLPNLRRDDSLAGRGVGLKSEGGFTNNFVLAFDSSKRSMPES
ncbi:MAG TPA: cytochrome P450 [Gemmataceae bacterium]|jgi:cytochrome P450|nr:cytochrome P450 [Gemmataceae bacterium]